MLSETDSVGSLRSEDVIRSPASDCSDTSDSLKGEDGVGSMDSPHFWKLVTLFCAVCWGCSYVWSKAALQVLTGVGVGGLTAGAIFGALRFAIAAACFSPQLRKVSCWSSFCGSFFVGAMYGLGYIAIFGAYSMGTGAARGAFITSMQAVVISCYASISARRVELGAVLSSVLVVIGVGVLELGGDAGDQQSVGGGDMLCMLSPLFWGTGWFALSLTMQRHPQDATSSTAVQLLAVAVVFGCFAAVSLLSEGYDPIGLLAPLFNNASFVTNLFLAAFLGNAVSMWLCSHALKRLPPKIVSVIVASEPVWSAVSASIVLGESFALNDYVGGAFMIAGVVCNEVFSAHEEAKSKASLMDLEDPLLSS